MRNSDEINYQHIVAVGITSIFPGFRSFIGWAGFFGLIISAILIVIGNLPAQPPSGIAVKSPPCNRMELVARDDVRPNWGAYIQSNGRQYVTEYYDRRKIAEEFERLLLELSTPRVDVPQEMKFLS